MTHSALKTTFTWLRVLKVQITLTSI